LRNGPSRSWKSSSKLPEGKVSTTSRSGVNTPSICQMNWRASRRYSSMSMPACRTTVLLGTLKDANPASSSTPVASDEVRKTISGTRSSSTAR